MHKPIF